MGAAMFYCSHGGCHLGLCWFGNIEFVVVSSIYFRRQLQKKSCKLPFSDKFGQAAGSGNPITVMMALGILEVILGASMIFATSKSFCPQIGSLNTCLSSWEVESSFLSDLRYLQALLLRMSNHYLHSHPAGSAWTSIHIIKLTDLYSCMCWGLKWTRRCSTHLKTTWLRIQQGLVLVSLLLTSN